MCEKKQCCQKPENLKDKPQACPPEQVEACHGTRDAHPCVEPSVAPNPENAPKP